MHLQLSSANQRSWRGSYVGSVVAFEGDETFDAVALVALKEPASVLPGGS